MNSLSKRMLREECKSNHIRRRISDAVHTCHVHMVTAISPFFSLDKWMNVRLGKKTEADSSIDRHMEVGCDFFLFDYNHDRGHKPTLYPIHKDPARTDMDLVESN